MTRFLNFWPIRIIIFWSLFLVCCLLGTCYQLMIIIRMISWARTFTLSHFVSPRCNINLFTKRNDFRSSSQVWTPNNRICTRQTLVSTHGILSLRNSDAVILIHFFLYGVILTVDFLWSYVKWEYFRNPSLPFNLLHI